MFSGIQHEVHTMFCFEVVQGYFFRSLYVLQGNFLSPFWGLKDRIFDAQRDDFFSNFLTSKRHSTCRNFCDIITPKE